VLTRKIIHVDMDAFFAAIEQRDNPRLRGKPVIVGGSPDSRGVVCTASYEARAYGVRSAMPAAEARRRCPDGIFVPVNMRKYQEVSRQIRALFLAVTDLVEPISLDEAFLDVTSTTTDPRELGHELKRRIKAVTGLTASVGISYNKFLAKLASDMDKPDGLTIITPEDAAYLLPALSVRKLWGVGPKTEALLASLGIRTVGDILDFGDDQLRVALGTRADELLLLSRGIDDRPVMPHHERKSVGEETTFATDYGPAEIREIERTLQEFAVALSSRLRSRRLKARTVTLKVRHPDFTTLTRSVTLNTPSDSARIFHRLALELLGKVDMGRRVRLVGLQVSNLRHEDTPQQVHFGFMEDDDLLTLAHKGTAW